ncbi:uncharacterized protein LOC124413353 [Diprion similis]|uniref:uncharacterized protein LOC124413353 n=1 Tax=Diprion similis TaxID=362088 RepID=UPI001EF99619|nr:uncharacterized protein LOC124413353 [Diprion similis]
MSSHQSDFVNADVLDPDDPETSVTENRDVDKNEHSTRSSRTTRTIPIVLDGKFFKIIKQKDENVQAECTQCKRTIKGRFGATTNFLNHLKVKGHSIEEYLKYKSTQEKNPLKRFRDDNNTMNTQVSKKPKQNILPNAFSRNSQNTADELITSFVVETMSPMSIVEHEAFKKLISGIHKLQNPISVMTRKTLHTKIDRMNTDIMKILLSTLESIEYVCTTADIWSSSKRSFLGVTVHWIDDTFERQSAALACRRFKGTHSYDKIAELLHDIHSEFKLDSKKIVKTTTDNASNMVKAFNMYSQHENSNNLEEDDNDDEDENEILFTGIGQDNFTNDSNDLVLPEHQRCASHTLNLIAAVDIKAALKPSSGSSVYNRVHHSAFGKCSSLWTLTSRSPKAAETYKDITKKSPSSPCPTRWNSTYDCLCDLMKVKDFLGEVCHALERPKFKETDFEFMAEYIECMQPIAQALDRLQGQKNCFYGELLPILLQVRKALLKLQLRHLKYCSRLVEVLLGSLETRFHDFYSFSSQTNDAILASVSHPFFKLRWVPKEKRNDVKDLLLNEVESLYSRNDSNGQ